MILLLSFLIGFEWYPISGDANTYEMVLNSEEGRFIINQYGGEENLLKGVIPLGVSIFEGGEKVLLPKRFKIRRTPENLLFVERAIEMEKYNRYSVLYKGGEFIREWEELKRETESKLGISALENPSYEKLREILPEMVPPKYENAEKIVELEEEITKMKEVREKEIIYPRKIYFSFLLINDNGWDRLIPVTLRLSPIDELIKNYTEGKERGEI